jgi:hypothetical protein
MAEKNVIPTGTQIMAMPGPEAELVLNSLPFDIQLERVLQVPWKERMDVIMQSRLARELVQAMPEEEVFWMVKQRGVEDSLPIIARTTHEQFQYLIDIDCWQRDQLLPENCLSWYKMLGRCNIAKVLEWFDQADTALLVASLKQFVSVHKIEEESDFSEEYEFMPPCTIDNINYFRFVSEDAQLVLLPLFKVLLGNDTGCFQSLIEGLIWDSRVESEEEALHWRQSRRAENGFQPFDEAFSMYQPLGDPDLQVQSDTPDTEPSGSAMHEGKEVQLRYALAEDRLPAFLRSVVSVLDAEQLEHFEQLIIALANRLMVADCMEVRDLDDVMRGLRKTAGLMSIGLEHLSSGDLQRACRHLIDQHPEYLFRCGYSLVHHIAQRLRKHSGTVWIADADRFMAFYGTPLADTALGLVRARPLFYEGLVRPESSLYRDFACYSEVAAAGAAVERLIAVDTLLFKHAALEPLELEAFYVRNNAVNDMSELTMTSLLATLLIANSLNLDTHQPLLETSDLILFRNRLEKLAGQDIGRAIEVFAEEAFVWVQDGSASAALEADALRVVIKDCLEPVREVLEACVKPDFDTRYVSAVLLK